VFGRFRRKKNRSAKEKREAAIRAVLTDENDFARDLLRTGAKTRVVAHTPGYLDTEHPEVHPEPDRPFLELTQEELNARATLDTRPVPGPGLEDVAVDGVGGVVDALMLEPMRIVVENFFLIVVGAGVLLSVALAGAAILEFVLDLFQPMGS